MINSINFGLQKPEPQIDNVNIETINGNMDTIDIALGNTAIFETAGGTATAITLTGIVLENGRSKTFVATSDNNSAATTINGKSLYKPGTTTAPKLVAGKAVTVWYSASNDYYYLLTRDENTVVNVILTSTGWTGASAPFSQTVAVTGVTVANNCSLSVSSTANAAQYGAASDGQLLASAQAVNSITIKAFGDKPTLDIPISVLILG